jgi:hypothetical protein
LEWKKQREERLQNCKDLQEKTNEALKNCAIGQLMVDFAKKAVDFNLRVKYELIFQDKWLERKLELRNSRHTVEPELKKSLRANSTKTSLRSQPSKLKEGVEVGKSLIFEEWIEENEEDLNFDAIGNKSKSKMPSILSE